ncbi:MAG: hypothetical protein ABJB03_12745 [Rhodoglobus sp.]
MTMTSARPTTPGAPTPIAWSAVQAGVWVGKRNGEFAGMIEASAGSRYVATTGLARPLGEFASLAEAKSSFVAQ